MTATALAFLLRGAMALSEGPRDLIFFFVQKVGDELHLQCSAQLPALLQLVPCLVLPVDLTFPVLFGAAWEWRYIFRSTLNVDGGTLLQWNQ